jgi:ankyrin repeat protein
MSGQSDKSRWWFSLGVTFLFVLFLGAVIVTYKWDYLLARRDHGITNSAMKGDLRALRFWLIFQRDINSPGRTGFTPLMAATIEGQNEIVRFLLGQGADVNAKNGHGVTALTFAIGHQRIETAKILIANGADPFVLSENRTQWENAAIRGQVEIFELLLPRVDHQSYEAKRTLNYAVLGNQTGIVRLLLAKGVAITEGEKDHLIATALGYRNGAIVKLLEQVNNHPAE